MSVLPVHVVATNKVPELSPLEELKQKFEQELGQVNVTFVTWDSIYGKYSNEAVIRLLYKETNAEIQNTVDNDRFFISFKDSKRTVFFHWGKRNDRDPSENQERFLNTFKNMSEASSRGYGLELMSVAVLINKEGTKPVCVVYILQASLDVQWDTKYDKSIIHNYVWSRLKFIIGLKRYIFTSRHAEIGLVDTKENIVEMPPLKSFYVNTLPSHDYRFVKWTALEEIEDIEPVQTSLVDYSL